ncbi:MAG: T9SS type A sorting domain-containing protein, partial [Muribaculaceae bacterium]|nr:T9SS type A sorting domain-containing protein [Muribaculaceae bacterium]
FAATANEEDGSELWISDGTEDGTYMIADINILGGSNPQGFVQVNENQFIFSAIDLESTVYGESEQHWLYVSDGTEEGTRMIMDCDVKYPGTNINNDRTHFVRVGRKVFFKADTKDGEYGETLWVTDGTAEGTVMLTDINTTVADEATGATASGRIDWMTNFQNKKLFFTAYSAEYGQEPWVSDGTPEGTYMIKDLSEGFDANGLPRGNGAFTATPMGDHVYFRGYDPMAGMELFRTDFTAEGTELIADLNKVPNASGTNDGNPDLLCVYDGVLFMKAQSGVNAAYDFCKGIELFYTDGTTEGTVMQSDLNPGTGSCAAWEGIVVSGSMFFRGQDETPSGSQLWELFRIDNKDEFPKKIVDLGAGPDFVHTLRNMCGDLYFTSKISPRLFKYSYRKDGYDPATDLDEMDPVFDSESAGVEAIVAAAANGSDVEIVYNGSYLQFVTSAEILDVTVFDVAGRVVMRATDGKNTLHVGSAGLVNGLYIVKVATSAGSAAKQIVVK